jgi:hypothetical protein
MSTNMPKLDKGNLDMGGHLSLAVSQPGHGI